MTSDDIEIKIEEKKVTYDEPFRYKREIFQEKLAVNEAIKPEETYSFEETPAKLPEKKSDVKIFGQFDLTYIVAETKDGLIIVDQHAAAERINFEKLEKKFENKHDGQILLSPIVLKFTYTEMADVIEKINFLQTIGFDVEKFGETEVIVRAVPYEMTDKSSENIKETFIELSSESKNIKKELLKDKMLETMACRMSLKAGEVLNNRQMEKLILDLYECKIPYHCPHGRPAILRYSTHDLEKLFKRIG